MSSKISYLSPGAGITKLQSDRAAPERTTGIKKSHESQKHPSPAPNHPTAVQLSAENREGLLKISVNGSLLAKMKVEAFGYRLQLLLQTKTREEMKHQINNSGKILIDDMRRITESKGREASAFIERVVPDQQIAAIEYWGLQISRLTVYCDDALKGFDSSVRRMTDLTMKLWKINSKIEVDINRAYDRNFPAC